MRPDGDHKCKEVFDAAIMAVLHLNATNYGLTDTFTDNLVLRFQSRLVMVLEETTKAENFDFDGFTVKHFNHYGQQNFYKIKEIIPKRKSLEIEIPVCLVAPFHRDTYFQKFVGSLTSVLEYEETLSPSSVRLHRMEFSPLQ